MEVNEAIFKMSKSQQKFNKNKIEILPISRDWGLISIFGHVGPKLEKSV